jgi:hypothetical protein
VIVLCLVLVPQLALANIATLTIIDANAVSEDVVSFHIFKTTTSGQYDYTMPFATVPYDSSGVTTYQDKIANDKNYYYVVRSVGATGLESPNSNEVTAAPLPPTAPSTTISVKPEKAVLLLNQMVVDQGLIGVPLEYIFAHQGRPMSFQIQVTYQ